MAIKKIISFLILLLILILVFSSIQIRAKNSDSSLIYGLIENADKDRKSKNAFESNILVMDFFILENEKYVRLYFIPECIKENLVGYSLINSFIILYFGIEEDLACKYLDLNKKDFDKIPCAWSSIGTDFDLKEEDIYYYKIINDSCMHQFTPNDNFLKSLEVELIKQGYLKEAPPPPFTSSPILKD